MECVFFYAVVFQQHHSSIYFNYSFTVHNCNTVLNKLLKWRTLLKILHTLYKHAMSFLYMFSRTSVHVPHSLAAGEKLVVCTHTLQLASRTCDLRCVSAFSGFAKFSCAMVPAAWFVSTTWWQRHLTNHLAILSFEWNPQLVLSSQNCTNYGLLNFPSASNLLYKTIEHEASLKTTLFLAVVENFVLDIYSTKFRCFLSFFLHMECSFGTCQNLSRQYT